VEPQPAIVTAGRFSVTNNAIGTNRFWRLRKPD
jgi:hypothetical protein